ncbi:MAG: ABC transporter ATP-binding protein [Planctomycetes bacterium]|nr:ABC transporter ATP-binding protein [Planctomycetota bacterium]
MSTGSSSGQGPLVALHELGKHFGAHVAVDRLTLDVAPGEILALLGPNGAGKTTTIRMLMGILSPTTGRATVTGLDCFAQRAQVMQRVGYLPDEPMFYEHLRGGEVVRFCGAMRGMPEAEIVQRTEELAERLAFADALDEYAVNYSMGMRKKLALTCALLHRPVVLVLDEPTNGLDPVATRALLDIVRETAAAGTAIFYSTHLLDQAERLCHRVAILHRGRLAALGAPAELRTQLASGGSLEDVFFQVATEPKTGAGGEAQS